MGNAVNRESKSGVGGDRSPPQGVDRSPPTSREHNKKKIRTGYSGHGVVGVEGDMNDGDSYDDEHDGAVAIAPHNALSALDHRTRELLADGVFENFDDAKHDLPTKAAVALGRFLKVSNTQVRAMVELHRQRKLSQAGSVFIAGSEMELGDMRPSEKNRSRVPASMAAVVLSLRPSARALTL